MNIKTVLAPAVNLLAVLAAPFKRDTVESVTEQFARSAARLARVQTRLMEDSKAAEAAAAAALEKAVKCRTQASRAGRIHSRFADLIK